MLIVASMFVSSHESRRAGVAGIEPTLAVLETVVLPLYDTPGAIVIIDIKSIFLNKYLSN